VVDAVGIARLRSQGRTVREIANELAIAAVLSTNPFRIARGCVLQM
jgi:hypothetical protein